MDTTKQNIQHQAMILALERQRNEALTREVQTSAMAAVLQDLLKAANEKVSKLEKELAALKVPQPEPEKCTEDDGA